MENLNQKQTQFFKGTGWILGLMLSVVSALVVYALSDHFFAAVAAGIPVLLFSGLGIEDRLQSEHMQLESGKTKVLIGASLLGFVVFIAFYIIFKLI